MGALRGQMVCPGGRPVRYEHHAGPERQPHRLPAGGHHPEGEISEQVGVVDLLLIEGELAAPVHGHLLGLPGEVHAALHEAGLPVIVGQTIHVQLRTP